MKRQIPFLAVLLMALAARSAQQQMVTASCYWAAEDPVDYAHSIENADGTVTPDWGYATATEPLTLVTHPRKGWAVDHWRRATRTDLVAAGGDKVTDSDGKLTLKWEYESQTNVCLGVKFRYLSYFVRYDPAVVGVSERGYAESFALAGAPAKTGYAFTGWKSSVDGAVRAAGQAVSGADLCADAWHEDGHAVTNVAQWTENAYGLSSSGENCTVTVAASARYTEEVEISWKPGDETGYEYALESVTVYAGTAAGETVLAVFTSGTSGTFRMSSKGTYYPNVFVKGVFRRTLKTYSVSVTAGAHGRVSRTPEKSRYDHGEFVTVRADPDEGYAFANWSGSFDSTDPEVRFAVTGNVTLTAAFTNRVYTLTFDPNGGTCAEASRLVKYMDYVGALPDAFQPKKQLFGWHRDPDVPSAVLADDRYEWAKDMTLYAHWVDAELFSVTGRADPADGGTVDGGGSGLEKGTSVTLTAVANAGYGFNGWEDGEASPTRTVKVVGNAEYVATFTGNWYRVYFYPCGGSPVDCEDDSRLYEYGQPFGELPTTVREGYVFDGWYTTRTSPAGRKITGDMKFDLPIPEEEEFSFYARWVARPSYCVSYVGGVTASGHMDVQKIYRDEWTALTSNAYERTGHVFLGWAETNDFAKVKYADGTNVLNIAAAGDTNELHAVWRANRYTVRFNRNAKDVTGTMADQPFVYDQPEALASNAFVRGELWSFDGWSNAVGRVFADGETVSNLCAEADGTVDLFARWRSETGPLSEAMGCDNLKWVNKPNEGSWAPGVSYVTNCAANLIETMLTGNVGTGGTLSFRWKSTGGQQQLSWYETVGHNPIGNIPLAETDNQWRETGPIRIDLAKGPAMDIEITHIGFGSTCYIADMTWTPHPKPGPGDEAEISSVSVEDGKFKLSFASDEKFDYNLLTNANLLSGSWGVMANEAGTGEAVTFEPQIIEGQPQLFYKVETIQKK